MGCMCRKCANAAIWSKYRLFKSWLSNKFSRMLPVACADGRGTVVLAKVERDVLKNVDTTEAGELG